VCDILIFLQLPAAKMATYSSALELWLKDPAFTILDPAIVGTIPHQVMLHLDLDMYDSIDIYIYIDINIDMEVYIYMCVCVSIYVPGLHHPRLSGDHSGLRVNP